MWASLAKKCVYITVANGDDDGCIDHDHINKYSICICDISATCRERERLINIDWSWSGRRPFSIQRRRQSETDSICGCRQSNYRWEWPQALRLTTIFRESYFVRYAEFLMQYFRASVVVVVGKFGDFNWLMTFVEGNKILDSPLQFVKLATSNDRVAQEYSVSHVRPQICRSHVWLINDCM